MIQLKSNKQIGEYLKKQIESRFSKQADFCRGYLREIGVEATNEEIRKQANRLSQILKGDKGIQITDLPIYSELLGLSCEQILSAGEALIPKNNRPSNYLIAMSNDQAEWEQYVEREDKLILNCDEYNKTAIDYALEFGNYRFLKFMLDKEYIWFVDERKKKPGLGLALTPVSKGGVPIAEITGSLESFTITTD